MTNTNHNLTYLQQCFIRKISMTAEYFSIQKNTGQNCECFTPNFTAFHLWKSLFLAEDLFLFLKPRRFYIMILATTA